NNLALRGVSWLRNKRILVYFACEIEFSTSHSHTFPNSSNLTNLTPHLTLLLKHQPEPHQIPNPTQNRHNPPPSHPTTAHRQPRTRPWHLPPYSVSRHASIPSNITGGVAVEVFADLVRVRL
ncbi:hypothetical protein M378DRAFT_164088, partial [Amanita muscaria Koide BX008]